MKKISISLISVVMATDNTIEDDQYKVQCICLFKNLVNITTEEYKFC